jgi:hypothetical protein
MSPNYTENCEWHELCLKTCYTELQQVKTELHELQTKHNELIEYLKQKNLIP